MCFLLILASLEGCAPAETPSELISLNGMISRTSGPVTSGGLIFIPESASAGGRVFNARVREDGSFSAQTVRTESAGSTTKPGIPAGRYRVEYHPPSDGSKSGLEIELNQRVVVDPGVDNNVLIVIPDRLPEGRGETRDDN
jgi:hypothetical protein